MSTIRQDKAALVSCFDCGRIYSVTARRARQIRAGDGVPRCDSCRSSAAVRVNVTDAHREFWQERFTETEIVEMAEAIWGPRSQWTYDAGEAWAAV